MGVGRTLFKKVCRRHGIAVWPSFDAAGVQKLTVPAMTLQPPLPSRAASKRTTSYMPATGATPSQANRFVHPQQSWSSHTLHCNVPMSHQQNPNILPSLAHSSVWMQTSAQLPGAAPVLVCNDQNFHAPARHVLRASPRPERASKQNAEDTENSLGMLLLGLAADDSSSRDGSGAAKPTMLLPRMVKLDQQPSIAPLSCSTASIMRTSLTPGPVAATTAVWY